jgi:mRNA-degrading endonuclease RelE of RelBE toxin-antitoxin system
MPDLIPSQKFIKALSKMSGEDQKRIKLALGKMQNDPRHNALRTKKIKALNDMYESRASVSLRIIWQWHDGQILLILVGGHEIVEY